MVLPGLTRASSSFTITSNHQNILPLWPAAPPPGQPVVFFIRCPPARWERLAPIRRYGVVPDGPGALWAQASCRSWPAGRRERRLPVAWFSGGAGAVIRPGRLVGGLASAPAIGHPGRQGPGSQCPPLPVRVSSLSRMFRHLPAVMAWCGLFPQARHMGLSGRSRPPPPSSFIRDAGYAPRLLRSRGARPWRATSTAQVCGHKKRRPPAWRPADVLFYGCGTRDQNSL